MKVSIDSERCQGHGRCYELAPDVFSDDERGRGYVLAGTVPPSSEDDARAAVNACPERAITMTE